jgi:DNA-binding transcriptional regulator YhcF (GntR family)
MYRGYVKVWRKLIDNPIMAKEGLLQLFIYCLITANRKETQEIINGKIIKYKEGSFLSGRFIIAKTLNQNPNTIYNRLQLLQELGFITIEPNNKRTLISIVNWECYQENSKDVQQQDNNKITTIQQQDNTKQEVQTLQKVQQQQEDVVLFFKNKKINETLLKWGLKNFSDIEKYTENDILEAILLTESTNTRNSVGFFIKALKENWKVPKKIENIDINKHPDVIKLSEKIKECSANSDYKEMEKYQTELRELRVKLNG